MSGRKTGQTGGPIGPDPTTAGYEVGYGKPPTSTRFKPGRSGNPKGRPKGARNRPAVTSPIVERMKEIVLEEAYRTITINDADRQVSVPMVQAIMRSLAVNAAKGNPRAQRLFTELLRTTERENARLNAEWFDTALTYKIAWDRELQRRKALGITGPDPLPHPDNVIIDMDAGTAYIRGPRTREEKAELEMWQTRRVALTGELARLTASLKKSSGEDRDKLLDEIAEVEEVLELLGKLLDVD